MPRANRHYLPGHVWHITHRCHQKKISPEVRIRPPPLLELGVYAAVMEREKGTGYFFIVRPTARVVEALRAENS